MATCRMLSLASQCFGRYCQTGLGQKTSNYDKSIDRSQLWHSHCINPAEKRDFR